MRGVTLQSQDAVDRIRPIDDLFTKWKHGLARGRSQLPERALDLTVENPFWTVGGLAGRLEVAYTTAQRAIDRLAAAGIVAQSWEETAQSCVLRGGDSQRVGGTAAPFKLEIWMT